jgi:serine/threonine protein kinase
MVQEHPSSNNNGKSSEPTYQISEEQRQQIVGNEVQNQESNVFNWQPNQELKNGRYIIQRSLSYGGFSDIYLAKDTKDNTDIVIKTLKRELQEKGNIDIFEENFIKEAMILHKLFHPNIVQYKDIIKTSKGWCIVMEYIDGNDLKSWVEENGYLSQKNALLYIQQIGAALIEVHNQRLLHRDVKPKNIIRSCDGSKAVLIDFGIARKFSPHKTEQHTPYFTEFFAPIEQHRKKYKRGAYTDVYALAATLYFLLTAKNPTSSVEMEDGELLVPPQQINPNISAQVNHAILNGMELEPINRPQSIQEWLDLLFPKQNTIQPPIAVPSQSKTQVLPPPTPPTLPNPPELPSLIAAFISPLNFLIALAIASLLGISLVNTGFWLLLVILFSSISFFIFKGRRTEQLIYFVLVSAIPTSIFFIFVPALRIKRIQNIVIIGLLLAILASLLGFFLMKLYRDFLKTDSDKV